MDPKSVWMTTFKVPKKTLTILGKKLPKIIIHKWKFGNLLEAPNTLPMKYLFVTKLESIEGK